MDAAISISTQDQPTSGLQLSALKLLFDQILDELHNDNLIARDYYAGQYTLERLHLMTKEKQSIILVASCGEDLQGFGLGRVSGGVGFLHWMGVAPDARGRGVGAAILSRFIEEFAERQCHKVELYTYRDRPALEQMYCRAGFVVMCRLNDHYFHLDVTYMNRSLRGGLGGEVLR